MRVDILRSTSIRHQKDKKTLQRQEISLDSKRNQQVFTFAVLSFRDRDDGWHLYLILYIDSF